MALLTSTPQLSGEVPPPPPPLMCPRCDSANTKFCYYNNYSRSQPRHFCRACRRHWTAGGTLRSVPVGGGVRKNKRRRPKTTALPAAAPLGDGEVEASAFSDAFRRVMMFSYPPPPVTTPPAATSSSSSTVTGCSPAHHGLVELMPGLDTSTTWIQDPGPPLPVSSDCWTSWWDEQYPCMEGGGGLTFVNASLRPSF